ncbi:hypothetical protein ABZ547_43540 [Streptomyces sparsogenes]|uniref:hypothetical protein n=1 Tax=Streptomyces sparsogenes TaxID=67365 RepID=UPI0033D8C3D2
MSLTVLLLMGFGLPTHDPDPATAGTLTNTHRDGLRVLEPTLLALGILAIRGRIKRPHASLARTTDDSPELHSSPSSPR